jgi:hypothetical protein
MLRASHVREGARTLAHAIKANLFGPERYEGDAQAICSRIVELCWDEKRGFYRTSLHNYPVFYARDFGMCVDSLLALGQKKRVARTLRYALACYECHGWVTQQIGVGQKPFNFPDHESPDSLAFLLHSLVALGDEELVRMYKGFLEKEIRRLANVIVDPASGLVKRGMNLAGMRDFAIRDSSCYDNVMLAAIQEYARKLKLRSTLEKYDYEKIILRKFWTGTHFRDDLSTDRLTGDANITPFWFRVIRSPGLEKALFSEVLKAFKEAQLDKPCALRYEATRAGTKMRLLDALTGGWERDTAWLHLGNMFLQVLARLDKEEFREQLQRHTELIERERNYPEVLTKDGRPHRSLFFHADGSMLWAANYLALSRSTRSGAPKLTASLRAAAPAA